MPFDYNSLSAGWWQNGHTQWHYRASGDTIDQVLYPGYFNRAANMLRVGDFISVNADAYNPNRNHFQDALLSVKANSGVAVLVSRLGEAPLSGGTAIDEMKRGVGR
jgi:hypothetical protein